VWGPQGFDAFNPGGIASHHVAAGSIGVLGGIFHLTCRPSYALYTVLRIGNIETVLASSTAAVSWAALVASGTMWYGSASNPTECFGPTRYMWDLGLYLEATETVVQRECAGNRPERCKTAWDRVPDRLAFYDYLGHNPAKGGLFRTGPMVLGDGIVLGWLGHPTFNLADGTTVYPRRMPTFFETFPTLFLDSTGVVRADQPFRRAEAKYSLESVGLSVFINGGALNGVKLDAPGTVAGLARTAQFGELLDFDRTSNLVDGVLRTSVRGWQHHCTWWHLPPHVPTELRSLHRPTNREHRDCSREQYSSSVMGSTRGIRYHVVWQRIQPDGMLRSDEVHVGLGTLSRGDGDSRAEGMCWESSPFGGDGWVVRVDNLDDVVAA